MKYLSEVPLGRHLDISVRNEDLQTRLELFADQMSVNGVFLEVCGWESKAGSVRVTFSKNTSSAQQVLGTVPAPRWGARGRTWKARCPESCGEHGK